MSRIGKKPIAIPEGVEVSITDNIIKVKGKHGEETFTFSPLMQVTVENNEIIVTRPDDSIKARALHGTTRARIANLVQGTSEKFSKKLVIEGVGYRFQLQGNKLIVNAGYSNPQERIVPEGLTIEMKNPSASPEITISGCNKQQVGQFAAEIRQIRLPEPYNGKGIRYGNEIIRRKEGKKA